MNILELLGYYLKHQEDVVTRRTKYELNKAKERAHILKGLLIALDNIDEVIRIIRGSSTVQAAKAELMEKFELDDVQAQAIVDMRLRALTGLEREKLEKEYAELMAQIERLEAILADEKLLLGVIREEILVIKDKYGDDRRTSIGFDEYDISMEDLIPKENIVITMTKLGYIKRMSDDTFKAQNRGGKGIKGMQTLDEDYVEELFMTNTHHYIMFFTNTGRVYRLKGYEIPEASRTSRGTAIINLLQLMPGEKITAVIPIDYYRDQDYLIMATKKGLVKKTSLREYMNVRKTGLAAITLRDEDELIEVKFTDNNQEIILATKYGQCIRFNETDVRATGRNSMGVRGINLADRDEVIGMQLVTQGHDLLIVSEKGMGKRTDIHEFTAQNRGGKGVKCYKITEKTGNVIGIKAVDEDDEIMIINTDGIIIRMLCSGISVLGRITSGVKLINLKDKETVASIAKVRDEEKEEAKKKEIFGGKQILTQLQENLKIAGEDMIPICQDTGMAVVFIEVGQEVHFEGGSLTDAINEGVRQGYVEGYLRKSVVGDPIIRENTKDNTPAVIHYNIVPGDKVKIKVAPKGFGSENMSRVFMLKPADGIEGVKNAILTAVQDAGPNACPPMVVGVGIGGTFEKCALMAKDALTREVGTHSDIQWVKDLEEEMLETINKLGIGPGGLGGTTTALAVNVNTYPTHIAGLPVGINICCHVNRHIVREV